MQDLSGQLEKAAGLTQVIFPDLWQQQAVQSLREGKDVVVHAPTGSGKTLIFELWSKEGRTHEPAIYTVPTRALANDKLAEWRARGWNVGIATGDLSDNLDAPIVVATLETQKNRLIQGEGPKLLVVDEYQMIGDEDRGLNYELAIAMAPPETKLLMLSGSVGNPQAVVEWLIRLGRKAVLVRHHERPVPLEEVHVNRLNYRVPKDIRNYWPGFVIKALADSLGPILIFAPQRKASERLAGELARKVPVPNPLELTGEQERIVGPRLAQMLKARIAYHHSGLSYTARAGVIEPLAKAGQLRVVVATMGLAAGINFSLRSVALAGDSYRRGSREQFLSGDEILQMHGRAGRRGIDETGYVLIAANELRLRDGYPCHLSRSGIVDWGALLGLMSVAADQGKNPFDEAVRVQERLFTTKPIFLGVETSLKHPDAPCGLGTDAERARHVRRQIREILNSRGEWQTQPRASERPLKDIFLADPEPAPGQPAKLRSILTEPKALEKIGTGNLCVVSEADGLQYHGRSIVVAERLKENRLLLGKWVRRLVNWKGRQISNERWKSKVEPLLEAALEKKGTPLLEVRRQHGKLVAIVSLEAMTLRVPVDSAGVALWKPVTREVMPPDCAQCQWTGVCRELSTATGTALLWRRLGLVDEGGIPTRRGRVVSFFTGGDGLAVAAALEDESYGIERLVYDLANLDAGFRFCGDDHRWGGRLAWSSKQVYGLQNVTGYLENGVPPHYGAGADEVAESIHKNPGAKASWVTEVLGVGDIDRMIIEWRSVLRRIGHSPALEWPRWLALQQRARDLLHETESPTIADLPPLTHQQSRRLEHRLVLRRY